MSGARNIATTRRTTAAAMSARKTRTHRAVAVREAWLGNTGDSNVGITLVDISHTSFDLGAPKIPKSDCSKYGASLLSAMSEETAWAIFVALCERLYAGVVGKWAQCETSVVSH